MTDFIPLLIAYSIVISVVILLFMAMTPLLSKRYSAKGLYYAWLVIVIGLIVPYRPQIGVSENRMNVPVEVPLFSNDTLPTISSKPVSAMVQISNAAGRSATQNIEFEQIMSVVWITGVVIFLLCNMLNHFRFVKITNRWSESITEEKPLMLLKAIKEELGIDKHIYLNFCPFISSPMMVGLLKPRILLPAAGYTEDTLYYIIKHELIHYKRKDLWYKCFVLLAAAMHWFNPIVYLMARAVSSQCELSCDAEVVSSADSDARAQYCETLLEVMKSRSKFRTVLSTNFIGGKSIMKKRIFSIMDTSRKKTGLAVICIVLLITAGVGVASATTGSNEKLPADSIKPDVSIKLRDYVNTPENYGASVRNVVSRPELEFYIDGRDIAKIEIMCENEYLYAVDWTETQHEKYWNTDYFQTYDEETQTCTFYPERLYDKSMQLSFDKDFSRYEDIWYKWTAYNMYKWASENNYSRIRGYGMGPKVEITDDMTEEQKLNLAAGNDGFGTTGLGHIQLDGYPEELTKDVITIIITDREGNTVTKYIDINVSNDELHQTVVSASIRD